MNESETRAGHIDPAMKALKWPCKTTFDTRYSQN